MMQSCSQKVITTPLIEPVVVILVYSYLRFLNTRPTNWAAHGVKGRLGELSGAKPVIMNASVYPCIYTLQDFPHND